MDRFIPCRLGENLQAKFEAASQKQEEEYKYTAATSSMNNARFDFLANQLGLIVEGDSPAAEGD